MFSFTRSTALILVSLCFSCNQSIQNEEITPVPVQHAIPASYNFKPKIQVAVLLDVSNSMDGLIEQAKAQLWNMVSVLGKARYGELTPEIEIALYEYGRTTNNEKLGYVKQINSFTSDLDDVSENLFGLKTDGGEEYCGHVIYNSLTELEWDSAMANYKVIFIAGNEDFLQGNVAYTKACKEAKNKGVIVNTIYCGDRMQGLSEHWNIGAECGNGSYTNINPDAELEDIPTPYDSTLFALNEQLNQTYISYGTKGAEKAAMQSRLDKSNYELNRSSAAKRVTVKGKTELYKNSEWDLVDAKNEDDQIFSSIDLNSLPDSLRTKSKVELEQIVELNRKKRIDVQKKIATTSMQRETYLKDEKRQSAKGVAEKTLEMEVEKILRNQAAKFQLKIE